MEKNAIKVATSAPGKTILSGEHSILYSKKAVAIALQMRTSCLLVEV